MLRSEKFTLQDLRNVENSYDIKKQLDLQTSNIVSKFRTANINFVAIDFDDTLISMNTMNLSMKPDTIEIVADKIRPVFRMLIPKLVENGKYLFLLSYIFD